jgi:3'(2'), 5'-bisphosphate nucleotidase
MPLIDAFPAANDGFASAPDEMDRLAETFAVIALQAGPAILAIYENGPRVQWKADRSPVCDADEAAEVIILAALAKTCPEIPVIAEEAASRGEIPSLRADFILVDPLDGTREFLSRNGEFTVNIALIRDGAPLCGVVYAPALDLVWIGGTTARMAEAKPGASLPSAWRAIRTRTAPRDGLTALVSRSHCNPATEAWLIDRKVTTRRDAGSALKFCLLAEGEADVYPRFGPTMEWDTAAGHAVLQAAGGTVIEADGKPLCYGKADEQFRNHSFIAWGDRRMVGLAARAV